jgi:hypothetical protein
MPILSIIFFSFIETILQLHYDHMVLVDYLISRDVGVLCAQYLLRLVPILHFFKLFLLTPSDGTKCLLNCDL